MSIQSKTTTASGWGALVAILAGMTVPALFRGHLNAEYWFIVGSFCAATLALTVYVMRKTSKNEAREQFEFEEKLRQRRRTNSGSTTSN